MGGGAFALAALNGGSDGVWKYHKPCAPTHQGPLFVTRPDGVVWLWALKLT